MAKIKEADLYEALNLPPENAIQYFEQKGYSVPKSLSENWTAVWQDAHAKAFTVARCTKLDLLQDIRNSLTDSLKNGTTYEQWKKDIVPIMQKKGWWGKVKDENGSTVQLGSDRRLKTIFETNTRTSYLSGRYKEMLENVDDRPYWMYDSKKDSRVRPAHKALDGKVFRYDDPFWSTHYPPNGWRCRCGVRALSEDNLSEYKVTPEISKGNLKDVQVPLAGGESATVTEFIIKDKDSKTISVAPDAGWNHNVGKAAWDIDVVAWDKAKNLPDSMKDKFISDMAQNIPRQDAFASLVETSIKESFKPRGIEKSVGWMDTETINWLNKNDLQPQSPVIVMQDNRIGHIIGSRKNENQRITVENLKDICSIISKPDAVYFDKSKKSAPTMLYIKWIDNDNTLKFVVKLNRKNKKQPVNYVATAGIVKPQNLKTKNYILIKKKE